MTAMAVSLRSNSYCVVPAIRVVCRLTRNQLILFNNGLPESRNSVMGLPSKSVFLVQFLSQRNIGSTSSVSAVEKRKLAEIECEPNLHVTSKHTIHPFQSLQPINRVPMNPEFALHQSFNGEMYYKQTYPNSINFGTSVSPVISEYEKRMIVLCDSNKGPDPEPPKSEGGRPSPEQLHHVHEVLSRTLPELFVQPLDYKIFHPNLIFENNIRGTRTVGIYHFVKQVALLRIVGHLKFAYVKFEIMKITSHPEDGTVKVRWRIRGISGMRVFLNFWKLNLLKLKESIEKEQESWYDGFSIFFVDSEGLVYKHIVDKMQPDPEQKPVSAQPALATKLALMVGMMPRECSELAYIISTIKENSKCLSDAMLPLDQIE